MDIQYPIDWTDLPIVDESKAFEKPVTILLVQEAEKFVKRSDEQAYRDPDPKCSPDGVASCEWVDVYLPLTAQVQAISLFCREEGGGPWYACTVGPEPAIHWARFDDRRVFTTPSNRVIGAHFKNWKHDRDRRIRISVQYTMP